MRRCEGVALLVAAGCGFAAGAAQAQGGGPVERPAAELRRAAFLGVELRAPSAARAGAEVIRISDPAVARKTGLKKGDRILQIDGAPLDAASFDRVMALLRAGDAIRLTLLREGRMVAFPATLLALPLERLPGLDTSYDAVLTDAGYRVRVIITRPHNAAGPLPAIFLAGWLSCDSVEYPFGPGDDGFGQLLHSIATQSGFALVRTEKAGVGDSEGPACADADFHTELESYRAAFRALNRYPFIDPNRVFILGLSNGAGFAPLIPDPGPQAVKARGYLVAGAWVKTWFEHMLELERRRLALSGKSAGEVDAVMGGYAEFHTAYLIQKLLPREVLRRHPQLAGLWYDEPERQYGRPAAYYHQLQELNLAAAWEKVDAPVLLLHGEYDWIMSRSDHELMAAIVNRTHPGNATFVELPKTSHLLMTFATPEEAFRGDTPGRYNADATELMLQFLKKYGSPENSLAPMK